MGFAGIGDNPDIGSGQAASPGDLAEAAGAQFNDREIRSR